MLPEYLVQQACFYNATSKKSHEEKERTIHLVSEQVFSLIYAKGRENYILQNVFIWILWFQCDVYLEDNLSQIKHKEYKQYFYIQMNYNFNTRL